MTTNAQAALIAAASLPKDPNQISYGNVSNVTGIAWQFKHWLDERDAEDEAQRNASV